MKNKIFSKRTAFTVTVFWCFIVLIFAFTHTSNAQKNTTTKEIYTWFDHKVGLGSTGLYNGVEYYPKYRTYKKTHWFLGEDEFVVGTIRYHGNTYYNIPFKIDIHDYNLVVKLITDYGEIVMELINDHLEWFVWKDKKFYNTNYKDDVLKIKAYLQLLEAGKEMYLFKKPRKVKHVKVDEKKSYYEFEQGNEKYYIKKSGRFIPLNNDKELATFYNYDKSVIKKLKKDLKKLKKEEGYEAYISQLFQRLNEYSRSKIDK